jgi:transposase
VKLHKLVLRIVARDELCRRYLDIPGVGPVTAPIIVTAIDDPRKAAGQMGAAGHRQSAAVATAPSRATRITPPSD